MRDILGFYGTSPRGSAPTRPHEGSAPAGNSQLQGACDVFKSGIQGALNAYSTDTGIFGDNLNKAGVKYAVDDKHAYNYRIHELQLTTAQGGKPGGDSRDTYVPSGGDN